jgi:hypothetical protein
MTIKLKLKGELQMFYVNVEGAVFKDDKWLIIGRSMKDAPSG